MNEAIFINRDQLESVPVLKEIRELQNEINDANYEIQIKASEIYFEDENGKLKPTVRINEKLLNEECGKIIRAASRLKELYTCLK